MDPNEQQLPSLPDAPDKEKMEQIRRQRMAKLGSTSTSTGDATSQQPPSAVGESKDTEIKSEKPRTKISITAAPSASPTSSTSTSANPFRQLGVKSGSNEGTKQAIASAPMPPARKPQVAESVNDWADKILAHIFRVTVDETRQTNVHGHKLLFLPELSQELRTQNSPLKLSPDILDAAILEASSALPHSKPLMDYLLPCWKRVMQTKRSLRSSTPQKDEILQEAKRLCMSYCIFALTVPELFSREANPQHDTLVPYLLREMDNENGICLEFLQEAVSRFKDDDSVAGIFTKAMADISTKLSKLTMNDDYKPFMNALVMYSKFPALLDALTQHPAFQMAQSAPNIEKNTILGPFFRISPLQMEVTRSYFTGPRTMDPGHIKNAQSALQITLTQHQHELAGIANAIIRTNANSRNKLLDWFAYILNVNHKRRAIQVDPREVASDGFMVNITVVLDQLCEPFMDTTFSKIDRIDVNYFRRHPRVDIKEETKLNADQAQSDAFYAKTVDGESNFISEVFFLNLAAHHYGSEATNAKLKNLDRDIKYYEKHIKAIEADRAKFENAPNQLVMWEMSFKRHVDVLEKSMSLKYAIEGVLLDEKMQDRSLRFMRYVSVWLLRVASQSNYKPDKPFILPLPKDQPEAFSCLPEYALQNVVDNFKFVYRHVPQIMVSAMGDEMIALCVTFLESSEYVRNPYLKSTLVTLLYSGTWPVLHLRKGILGDALTNTDFANEYLLHAIMKFYIEAESTGTHTQFYDKFNIRYEVFQIIKCVWVNDFYKNQLASQSRINRDFFVQFVNMLLNDATFVLDEALTKFPKIHDLQIELRDNKELSQEDRQKKEEELHAIEDQAKSYMQLANESVATMKLFTGALSESFTMPEIVSRLAGMLDYNLETLAGPKSLNLKVDNMEKYKFNPKALLPDFIEIYLNLSGSATFVDAVAGDGRSYKAATFDRASNILEKNNMKAPEELAAWKDFATRVASAKAALDQADLDYADAPAEYEDPIMGVLMRDPVILPSQNIVDRGTIITHLLSDPCDPFTRVKMTLHDVVPADDLRQKIEKWKAEVDAEKAKAKAADATADAMDITK